MPHIVRSQELDQANLRVIDTGEGQSIDLRHTDEGATPTSAPAVRPTALEQPSVGSVPAQGAIEAAPAMLAELRAAAAANSSPASTAQAEVPPPTPTPAATPQAAVPPPGTAPVAPPAPQLFRRLRRQPRPRPTRLPLLRLLRQLFRRPLRRARRLKQPTCPHLQRKPSRLPPLQLYKPRRPPPPRRPASASPSMHRLLLPPPVPPSRSRWC